MPRVAQPEIRAAGKGKLTCLLVGGNEKTARQLRDKLYPEGILAPHHWEQGSESRDRVIPKDADLVLVLTDSGSHSLLEKATNAAKSGRIPFIRTQRTWSTMKNALRGRGALKAAKAAMASGRLLKAAEVEKAANLVQEALRTPEAPPVRELKLGTNAGAMGEVLGLAAKIQELMENAGVRGVLVDSKEVLLTYG